MFWVWTAFLTFIGALLALDSGVFHRRPHAMGMKESLAWSALWISLGLAFTGIIFIAYEHHHFGLGLTPDALDGQANSGRAAALKYITGYVVEKALSVDNIFVIATLFGVFAIPAAYQHRVLFWGIAGALVMRGVMIGLGAQLIARYHWVIYVLGAFLFLSALKMLISRKAPSPKPGPGMIGFARRWLPVTEHFHEGKFLVRGLPGHGWLFTPLSVALITVEMADVVFAVDSIPAVFAVTADPFLVFTSNVFAILGMRSLYFAVHRMIENLRYLKVTLAAILAVVGLKMLLAPWLRELLGAHFALYLLLVVLLILAAGVAASLLMKLPHERFAPELHDARPVRIPLH